MFWSGNYIVVRELNFLLKEENVTLTQVLEADDILQECKADNKALIQFLTKPEILHELITLITEEPPQNVELSQQYVHASIAAEVLTSHLSMLSDRLSYDTVQMNRLCNFINREPPLNPLLASYFSKTVEMLLERSPKQDWYLYHIVCLRVLDFFKSRRDFLPNLLRHMSTSAIADIFKYFIRLDDLFNKIVMEWLEEHQFLDCMIQIICGTYVPEEIRPAPVAVGAGSGAGADKSETETTEKTEVNAVDDITNHQEPNPPEEKPLAEEEERQKLEKSRRIAAVAAYNAASLLCDILLTGCAGEGAYSRSRTSCSLLTWLSCSAGVAALLRACAAAPHAQHAQHAARVLLTAAEQRAILSDGAARAETERALAPYLPMLHRELLPASTHVPKTNISQSTDPQPVIQIQNEPIPSDPIPESKPETDSKPETTETKPIDSKTEEKTKETESDLKIKKGTDESQQPIEKPEVNQSESVIEGKPSVDAKPLSGAVAWETAVEPVGAGRVQIAMLLAHLALSEVQEVANTMITLGTPEVLVNMFFRHHHNNFLHAAVYSFVRNALGNRVYGKAYAENLLNECDLLNRLMDAFEDNESGKVVPRAGYMGHVVLLLRSAARSEAVSERALPQRWLHFRQGPLESVVEQHDTPLGGFFPTENSYEVENMADPVDDNYEYNDINDLNDIPTVDDIESSCRAEDKKISDFLYLANKRCQDDTLWNNVPECETEVSQEAAHTAIGDVSPWESTTEDTAAGEGWASFNADSFPPPLDPFAPPQAPAPPAAPPAGPSQYPSEELDPRRKEEFGPMWGYQEGTETETSASLEDKLQHLALDADASKPLDEAQSAELANNLLTAMSAMTPEVIANIVNANMTPLLPDKPQPSDR